MRVTLQTVAEKVRRKGITLKIKSLRCYNFSEASSGSAKFVTELPSFGSALKRVLYSPDGAELATTTISGSVQLWHACDKYASTSHLVGHVSSIKDAGFSPDSRYLATAAVEMSVFVWDVARRRLKAAWYGPVSCLDFLSNDVIVTGEATGNRRCLKIEH
jgi:WD40 repeat protein